MYLDFRVDVIIRKSDFPRYVWKKCNLINGVDRLIKPEEVNVYFPIKASRRLLSSKV